MGKSAAALIVAIDIATGCDITKERRRFVHRSTDIGLGEVLVYMDFRDPGKPHVDYAHQRETEHFARLSGLYG